MTTKKILGLLLLALAGCGADNRSSVQIVGRAAPSSPTDCTYAGGGQFLLGAPGGTLDVSAAYGAFLRYHLVLYVNNELADPATQSSSAISSSKTWYARSARVRVNPSSYVSTFHPDPGLLDFAAENTVPADSHGIPVNGKDVVAVEVISHALGMALQGQVPAGETRRIVLGITIEGDTADGRPLDTGEWYYPVDVCSGCLAAPVCTAPNVLKFSCSGPGADAAPACVAGT
jgi:hypothetical protein